LLRQGYASWKLAGIGATSYATLNLRQQGSGWKILSREVLAVKSSYSRQGLSGMFEPAMACARGGE